MPWLVAILTVLAAYLIGAIPFGYLVARMRGVNIFEHGSGNIGATNVGRVLGRRLGILVFALDFVKGAVPVALAILIKSQFDDDLWRGGYVEVAAGMAAFLGHLFPIYLRFRGGKGVATGAGAVFVLLPIPALVGLFAWIIVLCATRFVSLASIAAVLVLCAVHLRHPSAWSWMEPRMWFCVIAGGLVVVRHYANILRLMNGTESQLKETKLMRQLGKSLHVLAVGMWFGMSIFFTFVVGLTLFDTFEKLGDRDGETETWFPRPVLYATKIDGVIDGPKEQGTRAAGYAVGPMFVWYFAIQGLCGFIALATALPWLKFGGVHRVRIFALIAAVIFVVVGWRLERKVHELRDPRNQTMEAFLREPTDDARKKEMIHARSEFAHWHLASIFVNFAAIACVTTAMALAGNFSTKDTKEHEEKDMQPAVGPT